jgi:signal transduction histidine kinase
MMGMSGIAFVAFACTLLLVGLLAVMGLLLVVNTNRRHRHRAEVAEMMLRQRQAVAAAEGEAVRHTLREIGKELHDNVKYLLSVSLMGVSEVMAGGPDPRLEAACSALEEGMAEVERLGRSLSTDLWVKRSLAEAIVEDAARLRRAGRIRVSVRTEGVPPPLPPDSSTLLYRVFQEVVNNALKHSRAEDLVITLSGPVFALTVADNGCGFDPAMARQGMGLDNIRSRCALIGFDAACTTAPGQGCTWRLGDTGKRP